jgi:hypothetical protein
LFIIGQLHANDPARAPWEERFEQAVAGNCLCRKQSLASGERLLSAHGSSLPPIPAKVTSPDRQRSFRLAAGTGHHAPEQTYTSGPNLFGLGGKRYRSAELDGGAVPKR